MAGASASSRFEEPEGHHHRAATPPPHRQQQPQPQRLHHMPPADDGSDSDEEAMRRRSRPTVDDLGRRADALGAIPPTSLRAELARARRVDLEDLLVLLIAERAHYRENRTGVHIDWGDEGIDSDHRRGALRGTSMPANVAQSTSSPSTSGAENSRRASVLVTPPAFSMAFPLAGANGAGPVPTSPGQQRRSSSSGMRSFSSRASSRVVVSAMPLHGVRRDESDHNNVSHSAQLDEEYDLEEPTASNPLRNAADLASYASSTDRRPTGRHRSVDCLPEAHEYRRQSGEPAFVKLRDIFFYQDYVSDHFSDGRSLRTTIEELRSGKSSTASIPPLRVAKRSGDGKYYSLCNRRLACYHFVYRKNPDLEIPVLLRREHAAHMLPQGDGLGNFVRVGGGIVIDGRLVWEIRHCLC